MVLTSPHPLWRSPTTRGSEGHTAVLADAVAAGAREAAPVSVIAVDHMTDADWDILDTADGIVFGTATYMGNVSTGFRDVRRTDRQAV